MAEYIEREAAINEFSNNGGIFVYGKQQCKAIVSRLNAIPAADVVEVRHGRWKIALLDHESFGVRPKVLYCSECHKCIAYPTNYCPNCGARMDGDGDV